MNPDQLDRLAYWLDERFQIPGTKRRIGLDGLLGLVPGIGDTVTGLISGYIVVMAWRQGLPKHVIGRMAANVAVDWLIGTIPLFGDLFDFGFKANRRNIDLMRRHLQRRRA